MSIVLVEYLKDDINTLESVNSRAASGSLQSTALTQFNNVDGRHHNTDVTSRGFPKYPTASLLQYQILNFKDLQDRLEDTLFLDWNTLSKAR